MTSVSIYVKYLSQQCACITINKNRMTNGITGSAYLSQGRIVHAVCECAEIGMHVDCVFYGLLVQPSVYSME